MWAFRLLVPWSVVAAAGMLAAGMLAVGPAPGPAPFPQGTALLVGCSAYPNLDAQQLEGAANDVVLMRELLIRRFGFLSANIVTLSEAEAKTNASRRPTRANIQREFERLAKEAGEGKQVVILMSGHGGKIRVANPTDPDNFEPDGYDELFLCADAVLADEKTRIVPGAIIDNDLGAWVQRIGDRGAHVWIVVDCCHSGTMLRGPDDEVQRRVPMSKLVSPALLKAIEASAAGGSRTRGSPAAAPPDVTQLPATLKNVAVIYAAQPEELTVERVLPPGNPKRQKFGVLTYTINEVLTQARGRLTYRELAQRVLAAYARSGKASPTPFLEGQDEDREVLGFKEWPRRSTIKLLATEAELRIDAGSLQGLTAGTILAALPADVADGDEPLGYVKIAQLGTVGSTVEATKHHDLAPPEHWPQDLRVEVAYLDYGLHKLRVFVDVPASADQKRVTTALKALEASNGLIQLVTRRNDADWVAHGEGDQLVLEPGGGIDASGRSTAPSFGPVAINDALGPWLAKTLGSIARVQNLLATARQVPLRTSKYACKVQLDLVRLRDKDDKVGGDVIEYQKNGIEFRKDELIGCRLTNVGDDPVDATLLFIDAGYGISAEFPRRGIANENRLHPVDKPALVYRGKVDDTIAGMEHMVLIAVRGKDGTAPIDFRVLEQPTLPISRGIDDAADRALDSPLGELLKKAMYGKGRRGGGDLQELGDHQIEIVSWRVVRGPP